MKCYIQRARHLVIEANHDTEMVMSGPYPQFLKERILSGTGHLSNKSCAEAVVDNMSDFLQHVWLCHLSEENNHPEPGTQDGGIDSAQPWGDTRCGPSA